MKKKDLRASRATCAQKTKEVVVTYNIGRMPKTEDEWLALSQDMLTWAHKETSCDIVDFPLSRLYSPFRFWRWSQHNEYFCEALEITRYMVGSRRERGARERRFEPSIIMKTMPLYNQEFRELIFEQIKKNQENRPTEVTVIMDSYKLPKEDVTVSVTADNG